MFTVVCGLVFNKLRDTAADSLKDGGVTKEHVRHLIVRELADIKVKLDALSYKELKACIAFYENGVQHMYNYFDKCKVETLTNRVDLQEEQPTGNNKVCLGKRFVESEKHFLTASAAVRKQTDANKPLPHELTVQSEKKIRISRRVCDTGLYERRFEGL